MSANKPCLFRKFHDRRDRRFMIQRCWRDRPTSFRSPWQNGYAERLIGSVRRKCTDHLIVFNAEHLRRILAKYAVYYNEMRTHVSLGKDAPCTRPIERFGDVVAHPILGGLH